MLGKCLVFSSLEEMQSNFRLLWDNLSSHGIKAHTLHSTLRDSDKPVPPAKLSARLSSYPRHRLRNTLQADLQILGDLFVEDMLRLDSGRVEFLESAIALAGHFRSTHF